MIGIGVDLGGTKIAGAVVDLATGTLTHRTQIAAPSSDGADAMLDAVAELVRGLRAAAPTATVGVASAGLIDPVSGTVVSSTDSIAGWAGTAISAGLSWRLDGQTIPIINDVDAHALGESLWGAGRGASSLMMIAVGTGVGGAMVHEGKLMRGAHHAFGEIGHIPSCFAKELLCSCGRRGHLEAVAAGPAFTRLYRALGGSDLAFTGLEIAYAAEQGDATAAAVLVRAGKALGSAIAGIVTTLDPSVVILGGGVVGAGPIWWRAVEESTRNLLIAQLAEVPLLRAEHPFDAGIIGAASAGTAAGPGGQS